MSVVVYGSEWIKERKISVRTRELYESLFRLHIVPILGELMIGDLHPQLVRSWRTTLLDSGRSEITTAKAYRLLRAIFNTATDDGLIKRNPCRIKGADQERSPERPVATVQQVYRLAELVHPRFRALVLAAAMSGLRWGELAALRRCDLDLSAAALRVPRSLAETGRSGIQIGPTKSVAGFRSIRLPGALVQELRHHLADFVEPDPDALIFTGDRKAPLRRSNFRRAVDWPGIVAKAGFPSGFHFHDLRHTGNHLAASSGASTRELMHRMGHGSMRAALIYQHATSERDREIAERLDVLVNEHRRTGDEDKGGVAGELGSVS